jgi:signal transduction histidine kinase
MKLTLVSTDVVLPTLCREILAEFGGSRFEMTTSDPHGTVVSDSDLYVWDLDPLQRFPRARFPVEKQRHFFLVRPTDVDLLQQFGVTAGVDVILLKPVTRATLRAFLGQAVAHSTERASLEGKIGSLRMEREEILQRLLQANLKLQEYDQQRTNFLARIAHDIRTPLTSVAGFCGLLLSEHLGALTPEQADVLGRMQYSTKRLSRLTDGLFRLSLGKPCDNRANLQKGDILECVSQAVAEILQISQQRRLSIAVGEMLPADGLYFERGQIEQVLLNLLENACKFAPAGGEIEIRGYPFFW